MALSLFPRVVHGLLPPCGTAVCRLVALLVLSIAAPVIPALTQERPQRNDLARVDSLWRAGWSLKDAQPTIALQLAREASALADRINDPKGRSRALQCMSAAHRNLGLPDSAALDLEEALRLNERINYLPGVLSCQQKLATLQTDQGQVEEALDLLDKAAALAVRLGKEEEHARTLNLQGAALETVGRYEEAVKPYFTSIHIRKRNASPALAMSYQNLASLYLRLGRSGEAIGLYRDMVADGRKMNDPSLSAQGQLNLSAALSKAGRYKEARPYADSALAHYGTTDNSRMTANALMNRAVALNGAKQFTLAQSDLDSAMAMVQRADDRNAIVTVCGIAARSALDQHQPALALTYCDRGLPLTQAMGLVGMRADLLSLQAEALQDLGRYDAAVNVLNAFVALKDSLLGSRTTEQLATAEMREKYAAIGRLTDLEKLRSERDQATALRNRRTTERNILVMAAVLLAVLSVLLYNNLRHRRKLARQEEQIHAKRVNELLRDNEVKVLNAVVNGQESERQRVAKDLHDRLGSMLSAVKHQFGALESRMNALQKDQQAAYAKVYALIDDAVQEVRNISHDMINGALADFGLVPALEGLRNNLVVEGKLDVELSLYGLEQRLDRKMEIAVYHMVQELVANALKHARPSEVSIALTRSPDGLNVLVSDNGTGFDPESSTTGMGLLNVRTRAQELGATVHIDSSPRMGTTVSIEIPLV